MSTVQIPRCRPSRLVPRARVTSSHCCTHDHRRVGVHPIHTGKTTVDRTGSRHSAVERLGFRARRAAIGCVLVFAVWGCRTEQDATREKLAELKLTPEEAKRLLQELSVKRAEHSPPPQPSAEPLSSVVVPERPQPPPPDASRVESPQGAWVLDDLEDIGPAAPSSAAPEGVFLVNGANELFLAKVGALTPSGKAGPSPLGVVPDAKGPFALGRGPVFTPGYAYWVTSHYLLRRPTAAPYGPLEIISEDARVGTRAAAVTTKSGESAVAYIALPKVPNGPLRARIWLEKHAPKTAVDLTDSGNSTLSVALLATRNGANALSLEARMGVTALHVRSVDVSSGGLGADEVLWIGGTAQPLTEVRALGKPEAAFTLLAMEQDSSHFGLALLSQTLGSRQVNESWLTFPNGLDPAPVAATTACGKDVVLFARPSEPTPKAPQELVLAEIAGGMLAGQQILSHARAYYDVSLAPLPGGALVSFVADQRTWARTVRCPKR